MGEVQIRLQNINSDGDSTIPLEAAQDSMRDSVQDTQDSVRNTIQDDIKDTRENVRDTIQDNVSDTIPEEQMAGSIEGASEACSYLTMIDPSAKCYPAAKALGEQIGRTVKDDIDFWTKGVYKDNVNIE